MVCRQLSMLKEGLPFIMKPNPEWRFIRFILMHPEVVSVLSLCAMWVARGSVWVAWCYIAGIFRIITRYRSIVRYG